jgi:hypothetical protein
MFCVHQRTTPDINAHRLIFVLSRHPQEELESERLCAQNLAWFLDLLSAKRQSE